MRVLILLPLLALLPACLSDRREPSVAVRDSSGVAIVEVSLDLESIPQEIRLRSSPVVTLGSGEDPRYQFHGVTGAARLTDRRLVVANNGSSELRYYDPNGIYQTTVGRDGGGPGEFRNLGVIARLPGDTVVTADSGNRRVSFIDPSGQFQHSIQLERLGAGIDANVVGRFRDGSLLARHPCFMTDRDQDRGRTLAYTQFVKFSPDGALADSLGRFPCTDIWVEPIEQGFSYLMMPLGWRPAVGPGDDFFYFSRGSAYEIEKYSSDGVLVSVFRLRELPPRVQAEHVRAIKAKYLSLPGDPSYRPTLAAKLDRVDMPELLPGYVTLVVDNRGFVWAERYRDDVEQVSRWDVFDGDGRWMDAVHTPPDFRILEIGEDYLLGVLRDGLDVEHVQLFELLRPRP